MQLDNVWMILQTHISTWLEQSLSNKLTYEYFEYVDLIDKGSVIFELLLLDGLDCKLLLGLAMFRQIDNTKASIGQLPLEVVRLLDVSLGGVRKILGTASIGFHALCTAA